MFEPTSGETGPIAQVREGMEVHDSGGAKVGSVKQVQMGGNDPVDGARQAAEAGPTESDREAGGFAGTAITSLAETVAGDADDLPEEASRRLISKGFIEIGGGLFTPSRYATADQIASVSGDNVTLSVGEDALIKG